VDSAAAAIRLAELSSSLAELHRELYTKLDIEWSEKKRHYESLAPSYKSASALAEEVKMRTVTLFLQTQRIRTEIDATTAELDHLQFCVAHSLIGFLDA
jgi:polyhydroxyalkanoate synthesis regulator phasin